MIRFTWLRFRGQAAVACGVLVVVAAILALTGFHMAAVYNTAVAHLPGAGRLRAVLHAFPPTTTNGLGLLDVSSSPSPRSHRGLLGRAAGRPRIRDRHVPPGLDPGRSAAPLAGGQARRRRRGQHGRRRAAQRPRDLVVKAARAGVVAGPVRAHFVRTRPASSPVGYAAFAFTLGVTAGLLIRRTLPAMAVTLVIFGAVQFAVPIYLRPHLLPPVTTTAPLNVASVVAWGVPTRASPAAAPCSSRRCRPSPAPGWSPAGSSPRPACRHRAGHRRVREQHDAAVVPGLRGRPAPAAGGDLSAGSRYWPLQWLETAIYLAAALLLSGVCFLRIRRRRPPEGDARPVQHYPPVAPKRSVFTRSGG